MVSNFLWHFKFRTVKCTVIHWKEAKKQANQMVRSCIHKVVGVRKIMFLLLRDAERLSRGSVIMCILSWIIIRFAGLIEFFLIQSFLLLSVVFLTLFFLLMLLFCVSVKTKRNCTRMKPSTLRFLLQHQGRTCTFLVIIFTFQRFLHYGLAPVYVQGGEMFLKVVI